MSLVDRFFESCGFAAAVLASSPRTTACHEKTKGRRYRTIGLQQGFGHGVPWVSPVHFSLGLRSHIGSLGSSAATLHLSHGSTRSYSLVLQYLFEMPAASSSMADARSLYTMPVPPTTTGMARDFWRACMSRQYLADFSLWDLSICSNFTE